MIKLALQNQFTSVLPVKSINLTSFTSGCGLIGAKPMSRQKNRKRGFKWPSEEDLGKCLKLLQIANIILVWLFS
jgi:hypothetical protein